MRFHFDDDQTAEAYIEPDVSIDSGVDPFFDSASLSESVFDFPEEFGRTYHAYRAGSYAFPNDVPEQERLALQSSIIKRLFGDRLYFAPLDPLRPPSAILDVATGVGDWAIEMGDLFPGSQVIGTDLSPIQPDIVPPNVSFFVDDATDPWCHDQQFGYVHTRLTGGCWASFEKDIAEPAFSALEPGGWFESQEIDGLVFSDDDSLAADSAMNRWFQEVSVAAERLNRPANLGHSLREVYERVGFVDVHEHIFRMPTNGWARDERLKELGRLWERNFLQGLSGFSFQLFNRAYDRTAAQIEVSLVDVRRELSDPTIMALWLALGALVVYLLVRTVYRLRFHPLANIPGPRLTAATHLYEFLYNVVRPGIFLFEIEAMHRKYGPIVRINPREVHVSDPVFYHVIYASSRRRRDKDPQFVPTYGLPDAMVAAVSHDQHRVRRAVLSDLFSRRAVVERSELVAERVERLMQRLAEARDAGTVVSLDEAFTAMASDVITAYACGRHWGSLDDEHFRSEVCRATADAMRFAHISRFAPYLVALPRLVSPRAMALLMPAKAALFRHLEAIFDHVRGTSRDATGSSDTVITALTDPVLPPHERSVNRLRDETWAIVGAGTETTARVLTVAAYHLGRNPIVARKLRAELCTILPEPDSIASWAELEQLPYLSGVVHESLRLAYGLTGRLPRVAPTEALQYKEFVIPPGTPVSSSSYIIHRDASIFPDPERYDPERWIRASNKGDHLKRYLTSFSKGSRSCIGINLAYMELFLTIAHLVRRFDLELHDTGPEDVRIVRDMNMGFTRRGAVRVFAKVTGDM
ncbi:hypothetical protein CP533_4373 [Ophiocordyceps camponoti-saundersi (nom. inval.)]|nr:hypothetical protein CP533_4373 [Ophiocordyceps camponoti-saundersi (nom. inval.)]